jgi:hypothetical protein
MEIELSEIEGFSFVSERGLALDLTVAYKKNIYCFSLITFKRLQSEFELSRINGNYYDFRGLERYFIVEKINPTVIKKIVLNAASEGSLHFYLLDK